MKKKLYSYRNSGVNISLGNKFVKHIGKLTKKNVKKANSNIGSFSSLYDISALNIKKPIIVKKKIIYQSFKITSNTYIHAWRYSFTDSFF